MNNPLYKTFSTDELDANYGTVSLNKCGICLCRQGWADVLMNNHRYHIEKNGLCLYTPYTFIRILQHSDEFDGYLMETDLEVLSAALENIPVMNRLFIRNHPCTQLLPEQSRRLEQMLEVLDLRHEKMLQATAFRSGKLLRLVRGKKASVAVMAAMLLLSWAIGMYLNESVLPMPVTSVESSVRQTIQ